MGWALLRTSLVYASGLLALASCSACTFVANRFYIPPAVERAEFAPAPAAPAGDIISLVSWNVGYAGMGKDADFYMDLGTQKRPASAALVRQNSAAIAARLGALDADLLLLQEVARPSWNTYGHDVLGDIVSGLPGYGHGFAADIDTRFVPAPFRVEIGNATFSRLAVGSAERRGLPLEPNFEFGMFRKGYRMHITRLAGDPGWVIVNIHLSAFDAEEAAVRERQLAAVMAFAEAEYSAGRHVIVGGDWNMRLVPTNFAHTTDERFLFWVRDLPASAVPAGWHWAVDSAVPSVRTAHKPYVAGENYTLVIDGFLASPNVEILKTQALDLQFVNSDHNPVYLRARAKRGSTK